MDRFSGKRVRIAPKTAMSIAFKDYLLKNVTCTFEGFIDKVKEDADVVRIESVDPDTVDAIIILSPNHFQKIYEEYAPLIAPAKLYLVHIKDKRYSITQSIEPVRESAIEHYSKHYDESGAERTGTVFISKGFIGGNNKYLYLHCIRNNIPAVMVTDNIEQLQELHLHNLPCADLTTPEGERLIAEAKTLIFDQGNYTYFYISPNQTTVQLWHGVGLKKMAPHTHITYDYFVSTSRWTNETNFQHIFRAKHFVDCGYPRNDFLLKSDETKLELIGCDIALYTLVKSKIFSRTIVYMPTTREYLFGMGDQDKRSLFPLDLSRFNHYLQQTDTLLIIKLHPFVMEFFGYVPENSNFSNIRFHTPQGDIYPILKHTDVLISDYSSIVYDFLLLNRPIILFDYDREEYEKNMGGFLFDYEEYTPGKSVKTQNDLIQVLSSNISNEAKYERLRHIFFNLNTNKSSKQLTNLIF